MAQTQTSGGGGIGFFGMLTILFIGLKLTDNIGWSWWWVLSPLWLPLVIVLAILLPIAGIAYLVHRHDRKRLARSRRRIG